MFVKNYYEFLEEEINKSYDLIILYDSSESDELREFITSEEIKGDPIQNSVYGFRFKNDNDKQKRMQKFITFVQEIGVEDDILILE